MEGARTMVLLVKAGCDFVGSLSSEQWEVTGCADGCSSGPSWCLVGLRLGAHAGVLVAAFVGEPVLVLAGGPVRASDTESGHMAETLLYGGWW